MIGATQPAARQLRFAVYSVDLRAGEITKCGIRIRLQEHPFRILEILLRDPGEVITRDELRKELWPDGTFVDFDRGISSAVNKLRTALGDSASNPKFIETVGRRGYRFIYPVTELASIEPKTEEPVDSTESTISPARNRSRVLSAAVGISLLVVVLGVGYLLYGFYRSAPIRSVAVLPLKNLSAATDEEFFSEGLTDELTARLASLGGLRVISRTSAMQYKNTHKSLPQIAKELHVDGVVEGSVLRAGDKVRITVELIDAGSDRHVWAASYDREQKDILGLQNDLTRQIAESIKLRLDPAEQNRLTVAREISPEAHDDYLRGRWYWNQRTESNFLKAVQYFESALRKDPNYAAAYAGLADTHTLLAAYGLNSPEENIQKARAEALKALELDDSLAEAHTSLALIYENYDYNWEAAEREYRRAIELDPNYATAHHWYAEFLSFMGRFGESWTEYARARQLDPLSLIIQADYATSLYYARKYDDSVKTFLAVSAVEPNFQRAHLIAAPYAQLRNYDAAVADGKRATPADSLWLRGWLVYLSGRAGHRAEAEVLFRQLDREYRKKDLNPTPMVLACLGMGDDDRAIKLLDKAYAGHYTTVVGLKVDPVFDPLRTKPKFQQLVEQLRLR